MIPVLEQRRAEIAVRCRQFHVRRLDLFGSAAREVDFDPARSDVDLLVTYDPGRRPSVFEHPNLRDALAALLGRPVDLVTEGTVRNPFVLAGIERSRQHFHGA
ncbi:MAG: nucleotidyltransferase family protein [Acetobacteraceae bacterium]